MRWFQRILIIGLIMLGVFVGVVYIQNAGLLTAILDNFRPKAQQITEIRPLPPRRTDKLFTTFVYMPITDYLREDNQSPISGLCSRQYEVGIGYNDVWKLFEEHQESACQNDFQAMPNPTILSTNTVKSQIQGDYSQKACDSFDQNYNSGRRKSHIEIVAKLGEDGQWNKIAENSQRILTDYLRIYCPVPTANGQP